MEVHHHPHVGKKRFTDYLLEGLMIFIAVTMGFLAESWREHRNNKEREKEYINSLINNLEQDKTSLNYTIGENKKKITGLDSLLSLAFKDVSDPANKRLLYKYSRLVSYYSGFYSNDATMMQLKNSGGLQYIKHHHVADSIAKYDLVVRSIYAAENPYEKSINDAMDAMSELLVYKVREDTTYFQNGVYTDKTLPLLTTNPEKIEIFFNKISLERGWTENYVNNLQEKLPYATRLIELLKKEYGKD